MFTVLLQSAVALAQDTDDVDVSAEPGKGLVVTSKDGDYSLKVAGRIQVRGTALAPDPDLVEAGDAVALTEFAIRRARLAFSGHLLQKELTYYLQLGFSNQDTESDLRLPLRDAIVNYAAHRDLEIRAGQGKVQFGRQRVTSSGTLEFCDRSIAVTELNLDRDVGVMLHSKDLGGADGRFGYSLGLFGGDGRNRLATNAGVLGAGRIVVRPMGAFEDLQEADLAHEAHPKLAIGVSGAYNMATNRPRSTTDVPYEAARFDYAHAAADLVFKWHGFAFSAEGLWRRADHDREVNEGIEEWSRSAMGGYLQASKLFGEHFQLAARWSELAPMPGTDPELLAAREVGGGASWYFHGHTVKLQGDVFRLATGEGLGTGSIQARTQLQLWF
jgi:phosphate-selective porin OprO and OprP